MPSKYIRSTKPKGKPTGKKAAPTGTAADLNLSTMSRLFSDENAAREFFESLLWPEGPVCPHCGEHGAYRLVSKGAVEGKRPMRPGVCKCEACRKQFTVRVGTIFEESKLPLRKWLMAIHLMTSSKKGVSSHQIARELGVCIKTAWFLTHRIRECMQLEPMAGMLKGVVEADEAYFGGKPRRMNNDTQPRKPGPKGDKEPVAVLVERDGTAICRPMPNAVPNDYRRLAKAFISSDATLMSDESKIYLGADKHFTGGHHTVKHSRGEYARRVSDDLVAHNNTAESFFALLKRGHYGIFHHLSKQHLRRYCEEFAFRWKHRKVSDGHRMTALIDSAEGKRLKYKQPMPKA
jgi:transposase-like protein